MLGILLIHVIIFLAFDVLSDGDLELNETLADTGTTTIGLHKINNADIEIREDENQEKNVNNNDGIADDNDTNESIDVNTSSDVERNDTEIIQSVSEQVDHDVDVANSIDSIDTVPASNTVVDNSADPVVHVTDPEEMKHENRKAGRFNYASLDAGAVILSSNPSVRLYYIYMCYFIYLLLICIPLYIILYIIYILLLFL